MSETHAFSGNGYLLLGKDRVPVTYLIERSGPHTVTGYLTNIEPEYLDEIDKADGKVALRLESGNTVDLVIGALIPGCPAPILSIRTATGTSIGFAR